MAPKLSPINEVRWLSPDTEAAGWIEEKRELMVRLRSDVYAAERGSEPARIEASRMIFDHLGQKNHFLLRSELEDAASYVSDDLCIMEADESGKWRLTAASVCAPTYWRLRDKIGEPLGGLHRPVPGGDPELASRVGRIFSSMRQGHILERFNWTVQVGSERFTPSSQPLKLKAAATAREAALDRLHLRVERQTIRKLPQSNAVLFTIRICLDPLRAVFAVPDGKEAFAHAWTAAAPDVAKYKGWQVYDRLVEHVLS